AWYLSDLVLSFQGHPEFTPEYFRRLLERRREDVGDERLTQAMNTLEQPNDSETIARWMTEFIHLPRA
ncbi:MAG: amidotransferase, partial [Thalassolituus sp.]